MKQLVCPNCEEAHGLFLIETVKLERRVPDVTDEHIEYGETEIERMSDFEEIGVKCEHCDFSYEGEDWRKQLKGVVVNEAA